jgi:hypothetical protein
MYKGFCDGLAQSSLDEQDEVLEGEEDIVMSSELV